MSLALGTLHEVDDDGATFTLDPALDYTVLIKAESTLTFSFEGIALDLSPYESVAGTEFTFVLSPPGRTLDIVVPEDETIEIQIFPRH